MTFKRYTGIVVGGFVVVTALLVGTGNTPADRKWNDRDDSRSVGWLPEGRCMSGPLANDRAQMVVDNTNWTKIEGAATFGRDMKLLVGSIKLFDEMKRLGTQPCPDLRPLFQQYLSGQGTARR